MKIDMEAIEQVVENVARTLRDYYVFPEIAQQMSDAIRAAYSEGAYDDLTSPDALCEKLMSDLQAICHDKHIQVEFNEEVRATSTETEDFTPEETAALIAQARSENFGFYKIERLNGNIGYLDLRNFWDASWEGAAETAVGAMSVLANTDALIIDLRYNGGGSPTMVGFITSFLVDGEPLNLNSFYSRHDNKMRQSWTMPYIPGHRTPDKPVYVLTSKYTYSGAEEFCYNLKYLKRATLIGEATGGAAHPGRDFQVTPHYRIFIPVGRPINPITGTNWEGTGVEPDISVPYQEAFDLAYQLALKDILTKLEHESARSSQAQAAEARLALGAEI